MHDFEFQDGRRCPRHPEVRTSSPDGMFDAPCGLCEAAMQEEPEPRGARIETLDAIRNFLYAGRAVFTLVSKKTGTRFTYRAGRAPGNDPTRPWFVAVLTGPENGHDYTYLGTIFPPGREVMYRYFHGKRSPIDRAAPSAQAFAWFFRALEAGDPEGWFRALDQVEFWHEGR